FAVYALHFVHSYVFVACDGDYRHIHSFPTRRSSDLKIQPEDFGIKSQSLIGLNVDDAQGSLTLIRDALGRRKTENGQKAADLIFLNAGAALYAADVPSSLDQGVELAHDAQLRRLARDKFEELVSFTAVFRQENAQ